MNSNNNIHTNLRLIAIIVMWILPHGLAAQVVIKGSIKAYNADLTSDGCIGCTVIPIDSTKRDTGRFESAGVVGADENFVMKNVPKKTIYLKFSRVGFYNTIIKDVEFSSDTIFLQNIPMFERGCSFYSHARCTKKYFWGLFKITRGCPDIECHKEEPFNFQGDKIVLKCIDSAQDSITCKRSTENKSDIEVQYGDIKACRNNLFIK
jgi:hypothetical protein